MPLANVSVTGHLAATQTNAPAAHDLATTTPANFPLSLFKRVTYTDGTGAGQADRLFADNRSISGNDDIDLAGALVDAMGTTITFARIKAIMIAAANANTGNLIIGAGTNPFINMLNAAGTITIRPGGLFVACAGTDATGWAVTGGTGDILRVAPSTGTQVYDLGILGCSA